MGNQKSSTRILPQNDLIMRTVDNPNELPDDIRTIYINGLAEKLRRQLIRGDKKIVVNRSGHIQTDSIYYNIHTKIGVMEEVFQRAGSTDSWSFTLEQIGGNKCAIYRKIINQTKTTGEGIPTHIANQTMRSAIEKEELCSILFAPLTEETVVLTSCGHLFSKEGLSTWFQTRSLLEHNCPTCSKHVMKVYSLSQS